MKKTLILSLVAMLLLSGTAYAENVSVRGVHYDSTREDIIAIESERGNKDFKIWEDSGVLEYKNLRVAGLSTEIDYRYFPHGISIRPPYIHMHFEEHHNNSSALSDFTIIENQLIGKYGMYNATNDNNTRVISSTSQFDAYMESDYDARNKNKDYYTKVNAYREWIIEYDDCILAIDLFIRDQKSMFNEVFQCILCYEMQSKDMVDLSNGTVKKEMNDQF